MLHLYTGFQLFYIFVHSYYIQVFCASQGRKEDSDKAQYIFLSAYLESLGNY